MKTFKEFDEVIFEYTEDVKNLAQEYGGYLPPKIKTALEDFSFTRFAREIDEMTEQEAFEIKTKQKFYTKLLDAKRRIASLQRAQAWFRKIMRKYQRAGLLYEFISMALHYLQDTDELVLNKLFSELGSDELVAQIAIAAVKYLGWDSGNKAVGEPESDVEASVEQVAEGEEDAPTDATDEPSEVAVYEPQEVTPVQEEQSPAPVVTVERTVTHEVISATQQTSAEPSTAESSEVKKDPPSWHRPGGKSKQE